MNEASPIQGPFNPVSFLRSQFHQLCFGGRKVIARKIRILVGVATAFIPLVLIRALRPFVLIRFGRIFSERIGGFITDIEYYFCGRDLGIQNRRAVDLFCYGEWISNSQLKKMCDRMLPMFNFVRYLFLLNRILPGGKMHTITIPYHDRDVHGFLRRTSVHLSFTDEEERLGQSSLRAMGIPEGAPFVCFHARDSAYLDALLPGTDWSYHDYRDTHVQNYLPAAEELTRRGYFVIRMGAVCKEKLILSNARIIDYAALWRTDFLDIYLGAKCRFFISSCSGIDAVSMVFRRPILFTNLIPLEHIPSWGSQDIVIPKKLWLTRERRFLRFQEILESGAGLFLATQEYMENGIEVVENTPEEILAAAVEMEERLNGSWKGTTGDEDLQKKFWSLFRGNRLHGFIASRVGAEFLRQNYCVKDNPG